MLRRCESTYQQRWRRAWRSTDATSWARLRLRGLRYSYGDSRTALISLSKGGLRECLAREAESTFDVLLKTQYSQREDGSTHPGHITSSASRQSNIIEMSSYSWLIFALCFGLSLLSTSIATPVDAQIITRHARSAAGADTHTDIVRRLSAISSLEKRSTYRTDEKVDLEQSWEDVTLFAM